jgi:hypothetical protein
MFGWVLIYIMKMGIALMVTVLCGVVVRCFALTACQFVVVVYGDGFVLLSAA